MKKGRPKGYSPYVEMSYEDLGDYVGKLALVKVSRAWLESLTRETLPAYEKKEPTTHKLQEKIEYKLIDLNEE
jgi:hypothetical protein